jgi:hypothetical protein
MQQGVFIIYWKWKSSGKTDPHVILIKIKVNMRKKFYYNNKFLFRLANKQELPNSMDESEIVQYLNVEELVNKFQIPCRIVSYLKKKIFFSETK